MLKLVFNDGYFLSHLVYLVNKHGFAKTVSPEILAHYNWYLARLSSDGQIVGRCIVGETQGLTKDAIAAAESFTTNLKPSQEPARTSESGKSDRHRIANYLDARRGIRKSASQRRRSLAAGVSSAAPKPVSALITAE